MLWLPVAWLLPWLLVASPVAAHHPCFAAAVSTDFPSIRNRHVMIFFSLDWNMTCYRIT